MKTLEALRDILKTSDIEKAIAILANLVENIFPGNHFSLFLLSTQQAAFIGRYGRKQGYALKFSHAGTLKNCIVGRREELTVGFLEWENTMKNNYASPSLDNHYFTGWL